MTMTGRHLHSTMNDDEKSIAIIAAAEFHRIYHEAT